MKCILLTLLLSTSVMFAQQVANTNLDSLKTELSTTQKELKTLDWKVRSGEQKLNTKIEALSSDLESHSTALEPLVNQKDSMLQEKVTEIYNSLKKNTTRVTANDSKIKSEQAKTEKNFLYTVVGILVVLVLVIAIHLLTQRRANSIEQKTGDLDASTEELKKQLSDLSTGTSEDLASALEKFANIATAQATETEPDHTMVKEFAKQIISIENNMSRMDANDRGLKRIKRAKDKMHDTLKTMDYEITPLLGSNVFEGQNIEIKRKDADENITPGNRTIYNVLQAEIIYKGKQILHAQVDIKYNPND